jgi:hypothetical protein
MDFCLYIVTDVVIRFSAFSKEKNNNSLVTKYLKIKCYFNGFFLMNQGTYKIELFVLLFFGQ